MAIEDKIINDHTDTNVMMLILMLDDQYSFLPELHEVFGEKNTIKFLDIFSGTTLKVPTRKSLEKYVKQVNLYDYWNRNPSLSAEAVGSEFQISETAANDWYYKVESIVKGYEKLIISNVRKSRKAKQG